MVRTVQYSTIGILLERSWRRALPAAYCTLSPCLPSTFRPLVYLDCPRSIRRYAYCVLRTEGPHDE